MSKTTILLEKETREKLRKAGFKGQTYDEIITLLIRSKDSLEPSLLKPVSSKSLGGR